jgi:hypothetical protein
MHEHHGSVGMLSQCLIWSGTGRRAVLNDGVVQVLTGGDGGATFCGLGWQRAVKEGWDRFREMTWCCWCPWSG